MHTCSTRGGPGASRRGHGSNAKSNKYGIKFAVRFAFRGLPVPRSVPCAVRVKFGFQFLACKSSQVYTKKPDNRERSSLLPLVNKLSLSRSLRRERLSVLNSTAFRPHTHSPGHRLKEESQPWRPPNLHRVHILSNQFGDQLQIRSQQSKEPRLCL